MDRLLEGVKKAAFWSLLFISKRFRGCYFPCFREYGCEDLCDQYLLVNEDPPRSETLEAAEAETVDFADEYFFESIDDFMDDADCYSRFALKDGEIPLDLYSHYLDDCTGPFRYC